MNYRASKFIIAREAWPFALPLAALAALFVWLGMEIVAAITAVLFVYVLAFFRNPQRHADNAAAADVISPADGKIVAAGLVPHPDFAGGQALRIAIFMNVFNVHVNWAPVSGAVTRAAHHCGSFLNAMSDKCADENERKVLALRMADGTPVVVKLVAGLIARRIVCPLEAGDNVRRGDKIGLIRFGSRVEVLLPASSALRVQSGEFVRGGRTILATLAATEEERRFSAPEAGAQAEVDAPVPPRPALS